MDGKKWIVTEDKGKASRVVIYVSYGESGSYIEFKANCYGKNAARLERKAANRLAEILNKSGETFGMK